MTEKSDYQKHWEEMAKQAVNLSKTYKRTVAPRFIGNTDIYDDNHVNCTGWELDHGFISDNLYGDMGDVDAAAEYIMKAIKLGPRCFLCIWNDGGPKSCVHPSIKECPHDNVDVELVWTLEMGRTAGFSGMDWKKGTFEGFMTKSGPAAFDGTRTRVVNVKCQKCHVNIPREKIDSDMITAFEDEYE